MSRSGGMVDAAVSKTVAFYRACRFESDLRHHIKRIIKGRTVFAVHPFRFVF